LTINGPANGRSNPETSFIVQAPAGSGKTELLIQRYLKLLSRVDLPESIVAITFTKKAAGEMRARVLEALGEAAAGIEPATPHQALTHSLATQALARDAANRWQLLQNPARIRVQTIDSLSASITRQMPWLSRFGAFPEITEKAAELYREAARNTLRMVKDEEQEGREGSLSILLLHLDNNFGQAERLIAQMLEKRDQWLRRTGVAPDLEAVREAMEQTLERLVQRELAGLQAAIPTEAIRDILLLLDLDTLPECNSEGRLDWLRLVDLVLTTGNTYRIKAPKDFPRDRWTRLVDRLKREPETLLARLKEARKLPPARFEDAQWAILKALVDVLPKAVAHLNLVFRARGRVDFAELSIRALEALGNLETPSDLALSLGYRIEHLLVDEFQDTSFTQYDLLHKLTLSWEPGDGRTLFLVGDPMQSIYRFREADVSLFLKARREGIGSIQLEPLTLTSNFRSVPFLIEWMNRTFAEIFPKEEDIDRGAVSFSPSVARCTDDPSAAVSVHPFVGEDQAAEAERMVALIGDSAATTAILVRARSHLTALISLLRRRNIPFQAIEIDQLGERAVIQDLMALTFALLHLADRISWLAVLRAPWCGLKLEDLHTVAAEDSRAAIWDLLRLHGGRLTADGKARIERCLPVLQDAVEQRGRVPLRALIEQTWMRLGGPACVDDDSELADANAYFDLLGGFEEAGDLPDFALLREQVAELFAQPDSKAGDRLQIMTIHKAKGLEFDRVILPGLGQRGRSDDSELLIFEEQQGELLLAPMEQTRGDSDPLYKYVKHLGTEKSKQETARLLYVAATRARHQLHLLGCARFREKDQTVVRIPIRS
jgi:ATP-dependent helicase/nuclease subunit A